MSNFSILEIKVLEKIEYYCSGTYFEDEAKYPFVEVVNSVLTEKDVKEIKKRCNNQIPWNQACSLTILIELLNVKEYDVFKYHEVLEMSVSELFNKISEGVKRLKMERKLYKIQEDF